ncbi:galectin-3-like isoform X1 [Salvelinus alpinus]|uniref:galectin-3-like isoform X1 n=2 Tax=Salvelinus alpinus TaxID=8036 RepID=UPI0039FC2003
MLVGKLLCGCGLSEARPGNKGVALWGNQLIYTLTHSLPCLLYLCQLNGATNRYLSDALGGEPGWPGQNNQQGSGGVWPGGQPNQPTWPGQPGGQPGQPAPMWPGQQPNPSQPSWPGQQGGGQPGWPGQPGGGQPGQPTWPGQPGGGQPGQPTWPGQPGGGQPSQPTWPGQPGQISQPTAPGWPSPGPGPAQPTAPQNSSLKVPYDLNLPNGCYDKMLITIRGTVNQNAKMFTINLTKGNDIAMHLNPRFNDQGKKTIVRNSQIGNTWGKEEREHNHFPFTQGQPFEMKIMCTNSEFKVAVNSSHILEFKHRIRDIQSIKHLVIYNDVTLTSVEIDKL